MHYSKFVPLFNKSCLQALEVARVPVLHAHALYNSIGIRRQDPATSNQKAFYVQQLYWEANSSFSFDQQQETTCNLKEQLRDIRLECLENMSSAQVLAEKFKEEESCADQWKEFFGCMRSNSLDCSEKMAEFAAQIIKQSVDILKPGQLPCNLQVIALGSIAKGEATPYSDLEYLFLVEDKLPETVKYFERLAIISYFQIGNLGETNLSYMAIDELEGWFEDKAISGFKIDGLSDMAGNVPTGNGTSCERNHFIVTPSEFAERYKRILDNPDRKVAVRGDLTAMLTYMKLLYTHVNSDMDLLQELKDKINSFDINNDRREINIDMLNTDVGKFNFKPNNNLHDKGFEMDVKREIYRFPSILLLDIAVVTQSSGVSSWDTLEVLCHNNHISSQLKSVLELLLAAATYIRLSAYLYHNSQDNRISVSQEIVLSPETSSPQTSQSQRRWFVPSGLLLGMFCKMITLKSKLAREGNAAKDLDSLVLDDNEPWPRITTLHYTGRYTEAYDALERICKNRLCDDPISAIANHVPPVQNELETLNIISDNLFMVEKYRAAMAIYKHMTDNKIADKMSKIAACYRAIGNYKKVVTLLENIKDKSADVYRVLGIAYRDNKEYKKSEQAFLQALELFYSDISLDMHYDYYGNPKPNKLVKMGKFSLTAIMSPEERLSRIVTGTPNVIKCINSLASIYNEQGQYTIAEPHYEKALHLTSELYGEGAAVLPKCLALNNRGHNYSDMGKYHEAEDCLKKSLEIAETLSPHTVTEGIGLSRYNLGNIYRLSGRHDESKDCIRRAIKELKQIAQNSKSTESAHNIASIGIRFQSKCRYNEAIHHFKYSLMLYSAALRGADSSDMADVLHRLGLTYRAAGDKEKAIESLREALDMATRVDPDNQQINPIRDLLSSITSKATDTQKRSQAQGQTSADGDVFPETSSQQTKYRKSDH